MMSAVKAVLPQHSPFSGGGLLLKWVMVVASTKSAHPYGVLILFTLMPP